MKKTLVSLIVPCRNESKHIEKFLVGLKKQTFPIGQLEIIFVDGSSEDDTVVKINSYQKSHPEYNIKVLNNERRITPVAFNLGIKKSQGQYILPIGAHSEMSANYIRGCAHYLEKNPDIDCIGGSIETLTDKDGAVSRAIAISLSHPFGTGNAKFRNKPKEAVLVDTVFGGCYRRQVFERIGYYNEKLVRSQDLELNLRLVKSGGHILMAPELTAKYYPKENFRDILVYHFRCGLWVSRARRFSKINYKPRHYLPLVVFVSGLLLFLGSFISNILLVVFTISVGLYLLLSLYVSTRVTIAERRPSLLFFLPVAFFARHFGFGLGSFVGLFY